MTPAARSRRLRVAILGNSVPLLVVPPREERGDGAYPEVLEDLLADQGIDVTVTNRSRLFELVYEGSRRYSHDIAPLHADVLILHYGIIELQPNVLPSGINRHLTIKRPGGRGLRRAWVHGVVPRLWPPARAWQRWASARVGQRTWRLRPDRFVAELDHIIRLARNTKALVLVVDVLDPGPRLEHFMPGIGQRWQRVQGELRTYIDAYGDPDVRLVDASTIAAAHPDGGTVDGLHLTTASHRALAERLAKEIEHHRASDRPHEEGDAG